MRDKKRTAILGSGVAGAAIAHQLVSDGHHVTALYRKANEGSSFTNQKWQHSGLLYPHCTLAEEAWSAYQKMNPLLVQFRYRPETPARFLALDPNTLNQRRDWWHNWNVRAWGLNWRDLVVSQYQIIGGVGRTEAVGGFETSDCVIDFPGLITHLRKAAEDQGAHIVAEADVQRLIVERQHNRVIGLQYKTSDGSYELECDHCIVAMGAWSLSLLADSGITPPPIIRKKCIVLTYEGELVPCITVCLDIRKENGGTADVTLVPFKGHTLAAGTDWEPTSNPNNQNVKNVDVVRLVDELAQCFPKLSAFQPTPHVCIKTERDTGGGVPDISRKSYSSTDLGVEGLTLALPGKASFMFELAADVATTI